MNLSGLRGSFSYSFLLFFHSFSSASPLPCTSAESILKTDEEKNLLRGSFEIKTYDLKSVKDLYKLTPLINSFFEAVLVNDENIEDKNNRLALLLKLRSSFDTFADFTKFKKV